VVDTIRSQAAGPAAALVSRDINRYFWLNWFFRIDLFWCTFRGRWRAADSVERFPADTISVRTPIAGTIPAPTSIAGLRVTDQQRSNRHGQEKRSGHRINISNHLRTIFEGYRFGGLHPAASASAAEQK
jgi:hypothetical protein